jgi:hypothetical protein
VRYGGKSCCLLYLGFPTNDGRAGLN